MSEWPDISTAPKDGTEIIVGVSCATVWIARNAYWVRAEEWMGDDTAVDGWWSPTSSCGQELLTDIYEPTHWLPMPRPPQ